MLREVARWLEGWGWTDIIHPDDREEHLRRLHASIASGEPAVSEARVRTAKGEYRWMLHRIQPLRDELGAVVRWIGPSLDVEDLERAEGTFRGTERELRTILETIPAFVWTARPDGAFDFITGRLFAQTGLRKDETLAREWAKVLHPEDRERVVTDWRDAIAAGRAPDQEMRVRGADGTYRWFLTRAAPLRDDEEAILRWYGTLTDIDVRKRAEEELQKLKDQRHLGRFELADGGILFLDEAGELPQETQIALLRVLQERAFERVGGRQPIPVDVRVIAATNRDLDKAIADGAFRSDLYFRLSVFPIHVPPLRDRAEDIPLLVEYLTHRYAAKVGKRITEVCRRTMDLLRSYDWPGNVRELREGEDRRRSGAVARPRRRPGRRGGRARHPPIHGRVEDPIPAHRQASIQSRIGPRPGRMAVSKPAI